MARLFTQAEIDRAFDHYDVDANGQIERNEFIRCITGICPGFPEKLANEWFDEVDKDKSGYLDIEEFTCVVREIEHITNKDNMFVKMWNIYDADQNGVLDKDEFAKMWRSLFPEITDEKLEKLFKKVDTDGNGEISYIEYMQFASFIDNALAQ